MINENNINTILKYILFFIVVYIFTCFLEKKTVYFYLFIIFILAIISKIALYSSNQLLVSISWIFISFCLISLFADRIKNDNQSFGIIFDSLIVFLSILRRRTPFRCSHQRAPTFRVFPQHKSQRAAPALARQLW